MKVRSFPARPDQTIRYTLAAMLALAMVAVASLAPMGGPSSGGAGSDRAFARVDAPALGDGCASADDVSAESLDADDEASGMHRMSASRPLDAIVASVGTPGSAEGPRGVRSPLPERPPRV